MSIERDRESAKAFASDEGAAAVEYGVLVGLIALVIVAAVSAVGSSVASFFQSVAAALPH